MPTLGIRLDLVHSRPNASAKSPRMRAAALRISKTRSPSQVRQTLDSSLSKNSWPSCAASTGVNSIICRRTRQFLSSASVITAGSRLCCSGPMPSTLFTPSMLEMTLRRTSGKSSLSSSRKRSCRCLTVSSLPNCGARPVMDEARPARTCWLPSVVSALRQGTTSAMTSAFSSLAATGEITLAAAVRTSASLSLRSLTKAGARAVLVTSGPSASQTRSNWLAMV
mmetsp:Transcript_16931/g.52933  ORF Transcript_16931/g.52933 Transcript_16931/m.52933 type:complete len:224 (+) Transcript_16931:348-1019(+)